jgi:hydroxyacylglutathione hydrolase
MLVIDVHRHVFNIYRANVSFQDPEIQKFTGKTDRVDVMSALREAKNSM